MLNEINLVTIKPKASDWIAADPTRCSTQKTRIRLFCFPYAGGGTAPFYAWTKHFYPEIEFLRVQLPGRESRLRETAFIDISNLVEAISVELLPWLDLPFAFFGHSMGALIAFETTIRLREIAGPKPTHLFISNFRAPHLSDPDPISPDLPDDQFVERLLQYEGMPQAILDNSELMELLLPILRSDFSVINSYHFRQREPIDCPITLFGSLGDPKIHRYEMEAWSSHTSAFFYSYYYQGGHFYIHKSYPEVIGRINQLILPVSPDDK